MSEERRLALLNEPRESDAGLSMLDAARSTLNHAEHQLTHQPLDRDAYLRAFGRAAALREVLEAQTQIYRRFFET